MIYDSKVLFEWSAGPETNNYGWYEVSKEAGKNVIDDTERAGWKRSWRNIEFNIIFNSYLIENDLRF